ncbi:MAG: spermidine/putrescine ABC transporter substrate-binding protein [Actinomycetota bacterium]
MTARLSRRSFLAGAAATAALGLSGCASRPTTVTELTAGRTINVLNWPDYVDTNLLTLIPTAASRAIEYRAEWEDNYSGEELFGPQWDIVMPTNWLAAQLIQRGDVQQLPLELIPNHVNIDPAFLTNGWDRGARFHMPWQAGITGIAYDPALTDRDLSSVEDLFAPDLAGRVSMIGEMREAVGLAMIANGDDPARPTPATAEAGFARLQDAGARGQFVSWGFNEFADQLRSGQVAAAMAWSGDIVQLQAERPDIVFVVPDEGAIQWFDTMVIPTGAQSVVGAASFMNDFYDPQIAAQNTQFVQYISPVLGVADELARLGGDAAALAQNPILFPDDATRSRLFTWGGFDDTDAEIDLDTRFAEWAGVA